MLVVVIYSKQTACKGGSFTEGDEDGLVYLSGGVDLYAYMEQYKTTEDDQCGDDELGDIFRCFVHMFLIFRCKGTTKKRSHQIMGLRSRVIALFTPSRSL